MQLIVSNGNYANPITITVTNFSYNYMLLKFRKDNEITVTWINCNKLQLSYNYNLKGSVKEPNIWIYLFFFHHHLNGVLFPMFCLLVEGKCQILVF